MEQYNNIQQLLKKEGGKKNPVFPPTVVQAVFDAKTGASLEAILAQFNSITVQYQGSPRDTRLAIPMEMRRPGLTITYTTVEGDTLTERANSQVTQDDNWALDTNWSRIDELSLSGDIAVSARGTWIIIVEVTGIKAVGPKGENGITPWLKEIDNKLHYSYDNVKWTSCSGPLSAQFRNHNNRIQISYDKGKTWTDISDPVATYVRFAATSSTSQDGSIGKLQYSHDKATWHDLSPEFRNYLRIQGYVSTHGKLPTGVPVGTIYGVGPFYEIGDINNTNPMYQLQVWDGTQWVHNGRFNSIAAGIVQETGNSETEVMSQKAVTTKLSELGSEVGIFANNISKTLIGTGKTYDFYELGIYSIKSATNIYIKIGNIINPLNDETSFIQIRWFNSNNEEVSINNFNSNEEYNIGVFPNASYIKVLMYKSVSESVIEAIYSFNNITIIADFSNRDIKNELDKIKSNVEENILKIENINTNIKEVTAKYDESYEAVFSFVENISKVITPTHTASYNTGIILNTGKSYRLYFQANNIPEDSRTGFYLYKNNGTIPGDLYPITSDEFNNGYNVDINTDEDLYLYIRTLDTNNAVTIKVLERKDNISSLKNDLIKYNEIGKKQVVATQTTPFPTNILLEENNTYIIKLQSNDDIPVDSRTGFYLYDGNDYSSNAGNLYYVSSNQFKDGYLSAELSISENKYLWIRTLLVDAVVNVTIIKKEIAGGNVKKSDWNDNIIATYGDSVTAINNGDFYPPYDTNKWGNIVASYFGFAKHFGRGVGSQKFAWGSNGGAVVFVNEQTGTYIDRNNSYNYDNYVGNVEVPNGSIAVRGCSCSWLRITKMFPESIKNSINVVTVMYHNDASDSLVDTELEFIPNDATDVEWKNSNYYNIYGGDYNIKTVRGGIASTIMKMQAWMPNAVIVLCTPISGRGETGELNINLKDKSMQLVAEIVRDMSKLMSIPLIDVYATCGINGLNRTRFITDGIHPYSAAGNKMVARAIIGGLKTILPL